MTGERDPFEARLREALQKGFQFSLVLLGATGTAVLLFTTLRGATAGSLGIETLRFFSYFTIQSTLATIVWLALAVFRKTAAEPSDPAPKRSGSGVRLALLVSSILTAGGYYTLLADQWNPQGLQAFGNLLLHAVVPAMFLLDWLIFEPKGRTKAVWLPAVLALPLLHLAGALLLGIGTGRYPYPFLDPTALGVPVFLRNAAGFAVLFLAVGGAIHLLDRLLRPRMDR
jgi:hypothetical protein